MQQLLENLDFVEFPRFLYMVFFAVGYHNNNKQWYDAECKILRSNFYSYLNIYRIEKSETNQCNLLKARSDYKRITHRKRYDHEKNKTDTLVQHRTQNPKEYWKLLKQIAASNNESTITPKNLKTISEDLVTRMTLFILPTMMF